MSNHSFPSGFFPAPEQKTGRRDVAVPPPPLPGSGEMQQPHFLYNYSNVPQPPHMATSARNVVSAGSESSDRQQMKVDLQKGWKCNTCKLDLDSKSALDAHTASHITCTDCSFTAAPKVVKAHHQAVHGRFSGSGFKSVTVSVPGCPVQRFHICVGNRPEDVRKWIEERRQRFPRLRKRSLETSSSQPASLTPPSEKKQEKKEGIGSLLDGYSSSEDDASTAGETLRKPVEAKRDKNAEEVCKSAVPQRNRRVRVCRYFARNGSCRNGDACTYSHDIANAAPADGRCNRAFGEPLKKQRTTDSSLLRKLLVNDMRRENAIALQLLEFIVRSDFLQKETADHD